MADFHVVTGIGVKAVYREVKARMRAPGGGDRTITAHAEQIGWNWERRL